MAPPTWTQVPLEGGLAATPAHWTVIAAAPPEPPEAPPEPAAPPEPPAPPPPVQVVSAFVQVLPSAVQKSVASGTALSAQSGSRTPQPQSQKSGVTPLPLSL